MRLRLTKPKSNFGRRVAAAAMSALMLGGVGTAVTAGAGTANAFACGAAGPAERITVNGYGMPSVPVKIWRAPNAYRTVILLDGMRATNDCSGWEHELPNTIKAMQREGINVVTPIGGKASFYTNWDSPSNFNGQRYTYKWESVISGSLVQALDAKGLRVNGRYGIAGLSMSGNAAITLAAKYPQHFGPAASFSGYLSYSIPGMKTAIRVSMLDIEGGPWNVDAMWGPPWSPRWAQNDPILLTNKLRGRKVFVSAGTGGLGKYDYNRFANLFDGMAKTVQAVPLEVLAYGNTVAFAAKARADGVRVTESYANPGTHQWLYWRDQVYKSMRIGFWR